MKINWQQFKKFVVDRALSIQWIELEERYWLKAFDGNFYLECFLDKNPSDTTELLDFEQNFKTIGNKSFSDIDGTTVIRTKAAKKGWTYVLIPIEFTTSKLLSLNSKDAAGISRNGIIYKIYNNENIEITDAINEPLAVKTIIDYEPPYDYEVIGGHIRQKQRPSTPIKVWVVAVPDIPAAYGGSKEMVGGVELMFVDPSDKITADGRATKLLSYSTTYHTNKLRFIFKHEAGMQHDLLIILEKYRI